MQFDVVITN